MNIFAQVFGGGLFFAILSALLFVFWPADSCQRINNATAIVQGALGLVPLAGESIFHRDMTRTWSDIEYASNWTHKTISAYFKVSDCSMGHESFYEKKTEEHEAEKWLESHDPDLYKLLLNDSKDGNASEKTIVELLKDKQ